jgi:integrase
MLLAQDVHPKVVQEMLGHSTIAITMDLYSHSTPSLQGEAATKLDAALQIAMASAPKVVA